MPAIVPQLGHSLLKSLLSIHSEVAEFLDFEQCVKFIELVHILKPTITLENALGPGVSLHRLRV